MILALVLAALSAAQAHFQSGLVDLYAYAGLQAAVEFQAAEQADPTMLRAYWGEALANGSNLNDGLTSERFAAAQAAIAKAKPYLANALPQDRLLVEAVAFRYAGTYADRDRDEDAYRAAMERYIAAYPDDDDATMMLVEDLLERHGMHWHADAPADADSREELALDERVLARSPQHLFANHLCIHIYDSADDHTPAIPCAQRLDAMTFDLGQEHLAHMPAHVWNELGDGKAALRSSARAWNLEPTEYAEHDAYVGLSAAMMCGDMAAVATWSKRLATAQGHPVDLSPPPYVTQARTLEREGKNDLALTSLRQAAKTQATTEELVPLYPADERIGALLLREGRYADARDAFAVVLRFHPRRPHALFGMASALRHLGDAAGARLYQTQFARYWAGGALSEGDF